MKIPRCTLFLIRNILVHSLLRLSSCALCSCHADPGIMFLNLALLLNFGPRVLFVGGRSSSPCAISPCRGIGWCSRRWESHGGVSCSKRSAGQEKNEEVQHITIVEGRFPRAGFGLACKVFALPLSPIQSEVYEAVLSILTCQDGEISVEYSQYLLHPARVLPIILSYQNDFDVDHAHGSLCPMSLRVTYDRRGRWYAT